MDESMERALDEVDSLISLSESTIYSQLNDYSSIADSQDIEDDTTTEQTLHQYADGHDGEAEQSVENQQDQVLLMNDRIGTKAEKKEARIANLKKLGLGTNYEASNGSINATSIYTNEKSDDENEESEDVQDGETEEPPFQRSIKYLEKHEIFRLFQNLAADIVYQRPENPLQFIVEKLEEKRNPSEI